jgi:DNA-binding MarR family transcriptional regulator
MPLNYRLTTSFPYLVNRVGVRMGDMFGRRLTPYDISLPMYRVLAALWERPDQRLSDLSSMTSIENSTLSRLVGTLKRRGFVSRTRLRSNERTVAINLTSTGRLLAEELIPLALRFEEVAIHSFGSAEVSTLKEELITVYEHLNQLEPEITAALARVPSKQIAQKRTRRPRTARKKQQR